MIGTTKSTPKYIKTVEQSDLGIIRVTVRKQNGIGCRNINSVFSRFLSDIKKQYDYKLIPISKVISENEVTIFLKSRDKTYCGVCFSEIGETPIYDEHGLAILSCINCVSVPDGCCSKIVDQKK